MKYEIVWFKRDLRIVDNSALHFAAATKNPIIPLYIIEPELWRQPDMSKRHYDFLSESLFELDCELEKLGQKLIIRVGDAVEVLAEIQKKFQINNLWSHQETWNSWTYNRDKKVLSWTKNQKITWHQPVQNGVIRKLKERDGWSAKWQKLMRQKILLSPQKLISVNIKSETLPEFFKLGLQEDYCFERQQGGRKNALELLNSFLYQRGENYSREMSSPVTAFNSCSLISPHLTFGTISLREVFQAAEKRRFELAKMPRNLKGKWPSALNSFSGRLRWHCHFIQKLEDEPQIEFNNFHPAYNNLRQEFNLEYFKAWQAGQTGFPIVDAVMRCLIKTGWINFRMRAMLMSFASYHLWLPWQKTALHLARLFTDYEPGIHYSQVQMQSGTTGINAVRIYNPIKQSIDQDSEGIFIRKWLPELSEMPDEFIHTPWQKPDLMNGYPKTIVDETTARKAAAEKIYSIRKNLDHKLIAKKIVTKHGSRKSGLKQTVSEKTVRQKKSIKKLNDDKQGDLFR